MSTLSIIRSSPLIIGLTSIALSAVSHATPRQAVVVNAPVAPDSIYVAREGPTGGLSVVDLNGFGASTGEPDFDLVFGQGSEGQTRFPFNPNLALQGALLTPPLTVGTTELDGGSSGVFSLTKASDLDDLLLRRPSFASLGDLALGAPLDLLLNNGLPVGCSQGGGNLCADSSLQVLNVAVSGPNTVRPAGPLDRVIHSVTAGGNPISFAPMPNPPMRTAIPLCLDPFIAGNEPTSVDSILGIGLVNLLAPGDAFGIPSLGIPPTGLLSLEQNSFFAGPSSPQATVQLCNPYVMRQQIGHFLYLTDRTAGEVMVLNSNTFEVLDRIAVGDPVEFAMGPNLDLLAVADRAGDAVHFIDVNPRSNSFHSIVTTTQVGDRPAGIAWDPGNEDILVCNEGDDTISVLSAFTLDVRKTVGAQGLRRPFALAITPRQDTFGLQRDVYFAWILDRSGSLWLFESGPNSSGGWGFDNIIGRASQTFSGARNIQPDPIHLEGGVWITYETPGGGAVSNVVLDAGIGRVLLKDGEKPNLRDIRFDVVASVGPDQLTGLPRDLAFDNLRNLGALPNVANDFSAGTPAQINGKGTIRNLPGVGVVNTNEATYLFVSVQGGSAGEGAIDVIDLSTSLRIDTNVFAEGIQSIPVPGARTVMDYFRQ